MVTVSAPPPVAAGGGVFTPTWVDQIVSVMILNRLGLVWGSPQALWNKEKPRRLGSGQGLGKVDVNRILNYLPASLVRYHVTKPDCGFPPSEEMPNRNSRMRKLIPEQDDHRVGCG
jgi:hypothetical protein